MTADVTLFHGRNQFRDALNSVERVQELRLLNKINLITPTKITQVHGKYKIEAVVTTING